LGGENPGFGERTILRLGLLGAGLIPQADADQDEERRHGRRHQAQQLRADPRELCHRGCSDRSCLPPPSRPQQIEVR
jgi:hypothetical protein